MKASKFYRSTKVKYLSRHEMRIVFESNLLAELRKQYRSLCIDVCDDFECVKLKGEMQEGNAAIAELQNYLKKVEGKVYKCSKLVRVLLTTSETKQYLQQLLRNRDLASAWKITDNICIIYGISTEDICCVEEIFNKVLITDIIQLSDGQKGLLQTKLGIAEVSHITSTYNGNLEIDISETTVEFACIQRIQEEVTKRLKKFLHKHEAVTTVQELQCGIFHFLQRFRREEMDDLKNRCQEILVEITSFEENLKCGIVLTGKRDFCKTAFLEVEKLLTGITSCEHTLKGFGLIPFFQSQSGRSLTLALETNSNCILQFPDGSSFCQKKVCVCRYMDFEFVVLHEDISSIPTGLAYIPCSPSCEVKERIKGIYSLQ